MLCYIVNEVLVSHSVKPRRIHSLEALLNDCVAFYANLISLLPKARILDPYNVEFRYPGDFATVKGAKEAVLSLREMRKRLRKALGV